MTATPTATFDAAGARLYFTLANSGTVGGLSVPNEDIVVWDGSAFSLYFDGSDVGLTSFTIDAFSILGPNELLLSFTGADSIPGIAGTVDGADIVKFTATSLGSNTAGTFELYFQGSDVGLTGENENIDALDVLPSGHLLMSTSGTLSVPSVTGSSKDIVEFTPTSLGYATAGSWSLYFLGSNVGLTTSDENIDGLAVDGSGRIHLSTIGNFAVPSISGANEDVFVFTPASLGITTAGSYVPSLFFDGSLYGLTSNDVRAIDLP